MAVVHGVMSRSDSQATKKCKNAKISYTVSVERIIGLTMCKVLFLKILTVAWFILCSCEEDTKLSLHICI